MKNEQLDRTLCDVVELRTLKPGEWCVPAPEQTITAGEGLNQAPKAACAGCGQPANKYRRINNSFDGCVDCQALFVNGVTHPPKPTEKPRGAHDWDVVVAPGWEWP